MSISVQNVASMFTANQLKGTGKKKEKSMEKLSSGFRINRAADDASGLKISETMRKKIRGLMQGGNNMEDGVSWTQVADGALAEVDDMLHRMTELAVKSANGTLSESDRQAIQKEYEALRTEIDRISETSKFNDQKVFENHNRLNSYVLNGNKLWSTTRIHRVVIPDNTLTVSYVPESGKPAKTTTIEVPEGNYSTEALVEVMNNQIFGDGSANDGLYVEYNGGLVSMRLDGGYEIGDMSGGLTYLFQDVFNGGAVGQLVGTTIFETDSARLTIKAGQNDHMSFDIYDYYTRETTTKNITIPAGSYTKQQLIDTLNSHLSGTEIRATSYGKSIKMGSDDAMITRFKGNMFKIDGGSSAYTSVFYDNVYYGDVVVSAAEYRGGAVRPEDPRDAEHKYYEIDSANNKLVFSDTNQNGFTATVTIPPGKYTVNEMIQKLNELFQDPNQDHVTDDALDLKASLVDEAQFQGIRITSLLKGEGSKVGMVADGAQSTALNTLFRAKNAYGYYQSCSTINNSSVASSATAYFQGGKTFSSANATLPVTLDSGNNSFTLKLKDENGTYHSANVTVAAGTYTTADDLAAAVSTAVKSAVGSSSAMTGAFGSNAADLLTISNSGGKIKLAASTSSGIIGFQLSAVSGNSGYNNLFVGQGNDMVDQTATGSTVVGNTAFTDSTVIDSTNKTLVIQVGSINSGNSSYWGSGYANTYSVTLPEGNVAEHKDEILNILNHAVDKNVWLEANSNATGYAGAYSAQTTAGSTHKVEGTTIHTETPAKLTVSMGLSDQITIDKNNNKLALTVRDANGSLKNASMTLTTGTYTKQQFLSELQRTLNLGLGTGYGGVDAGIEGNKLVFTARIDPDEDESGVNSYVGFYSKSDDNNSLVYDHTAASKTYGTMEQTITIESGKTSFQVSYKDPDHTNFTPGSISIPPGTYTRQTLITVMNTQFEAAIIPLTASVDGSGKLQLTTGGKGPKNTVRCFYDGSTSSAMPAIFGSKNGITASFNGSNQLAIQSNGSELPYVRLTSENGRGSVFQQKKNQDFTINPTSAEAAVRSYLQGVTLENTTVIDENNDNLTLTYRSPSKTSTVSITMEHASYTKDQLAAALQEKLNEALHNKGETHDVSVEVKNGGLRIYAGGPGSSYTFSVGQSTYIDTRESGYPSSVSVPYMTGGDFYDKVLNKPQQINQTLPVSVRDGGVALSSTHAPGVVGRKDIVSEPVEIHRDINDTLTVDVGLGNESVTLSAKLEPGTYTSSELKNKLQQLFDEAGKQVTIGGQSLEPGTLKVGVGDITTGVTGSNDSVALNFSLDINKLRSTGTWKVEGVGGSAAFSVFYQTDAELMPAFIKGGKDLSKGVEIKAGQDTLSLEVDGVPYSFRIPHGHYSAQQIMDTLNNLFNQSSAPLTAELDRNALKISHREMGHHELTSVNGNAKAELFYPSKIEREATDGRVRIQMSDEVEDSLHIRKPAVNSTVLGLRVCDVDIPKEARRTLAMLNYALNQVSVVRTMYGAMQNRLEHAINSNNNAAENLTASESRIRDTRMDKETVTLATAGILEQAGTSFMVQQNKDREAVINLLKQ